MPAHTHSHMSSALYPQLSATRQRSDLDFLPSFSSMTRPHTKPTTTPTTERPFLRYRKRKSLLQLTALHHACQPPPRKHTSAHAEAHLNELRWHTRHNQDQPEKAASTRVAGERGRGRGGYKGQHFNTDPDTCFKRGGKRHWSKNCHNVDREEWFLPPEEWLSFIRLTKRAGDGSWVQTTGLNTAGTRYLAHACTLQGRIACFTFHLQ